MKEPRKSTEWDPWSEFGWQVVIPQRSCLKNWPSGLSIKYDAFYRSAFDVLIHWGNDLLGQPPQVPLGAPRPSDGQLTDNRL